jgi:hypothetical protein
MAQPPTRTAIPPVPNAPARGVNIHGQLNPAPPSQQQEADREQPQPQRQQVNIHGQPPQPNMAPPEEVPSGLGDNTIAEMEAGRKNLQHYGDRNNAEHEAGRQALGQRNR